MSDRYLGRTTTTSLVGSAPFLTTCLIGLLYCQGEHILCDSGYRVEEMTVTSDIWVSVIEFTCTNEEDLYFPPNSTISSKGQDTDTAGCGRLGGGIYKISYDAYTFTTDDSSNSQSRIANLTFWCADGQESYGPFGIA